MSESARSDDRPDQPGGSISSDLIEALFGDQSPQARAYVDLLAHQGIDWGLLGPREADRLWERHLLNSAGLAACLPEAGAYVADIGSGAGLPGIPLALARPDLRIDLVEPMQRRVDFLDLCLDRLALADRVRVVRARAEDYHATPDFVTCRALAPLKSLLPLLSALVPPACLLAIKGERAHAEVAAAQSLLRRRALGATVIPVGLSATGQLSLLGQESDVTPVATLVRVAGL